MNKSYTIVITKEHCENTTYDSCEDCALSRAIRQQVPEFKLRSVAGSYVRDESNNLWDFNHYLGDYDNRFNSWHGASFRALLSGEIKEVVVVLTNPNHVDLTPAIKETIRYVVVPATISKQTTIMLVDAGN